VEVFGDRHRDHGTSEADEGRMDPGNVVAVFVDRHMDLGTSEADVDRKDHRTDLWNAVGHRKDLRMRPDAVAHEVRHMGLGSVVAVRRNGLLAVVRNPQADSRVGVYVSFV